MALRIHFVLLVQNICVAKGEYLSFLKIYQSDTLSSSLLLSLLLSYLFF